MENRLRFSFTGTGGALLLIYLKNIILSIITLGIYSFWARVNITRYMYQNTVFMDSNFEYHATGKEKFIGFLKALGIFAVYVAFLAGLEYVLGMFLDPAVTPLIEMAVIYLTILAAVPFIMVGSDRYRLSRSSWRAIRFRFSGTTGQFAKIFYPGILLLVITLGFYAPWYYVSVRSFFVNNYHYGSEQFKYSGSGKGLIKTFYLGMFLTVITFGIYSFWLSAAIERYDKEHTSIQGKNFHSSITGSDLFGMALLGSVMIVFTLGFGFPWFMVMTMKMLLGALTIDEGLDLAAITAGPEASGSALADGLSEVADVADSVGSMFG